MDRPSPPDADAAEVARMLRALLGRVEAGELAAPPGFAERLSGAAVALDVLSGRPAPSTTEGDD